MVANPVQSTPDVAGVFARVTQRYHWCGPGARSYVRMKLHRDPVNRDLLALAARDGFGDVLDVGCGRGQLGIALLEAGLAHSVTAVDRHAGHVAQARHAAVGLAHHADVTDLAAGGDLPPATTALLIDVLYQLETDAQHALLRMVARAARRRIVIRTLDPDRGVRSVLTLGLERLLRRVSPHAGSYVNALPVRRLMAMLGELGFAVSVAPCWRGTPFANVLLIGLRDG